MCKTPVAVKDAVKSLRLCLPAAPGKKKGFVGGSSAAYFEDMDSLYEGGRGSHDG